MTVTVKVLIPAKTAENSQTTQYTATNVTTIIDKFTATNYSATAATLSVNLVTAADTAGAARDVAEAGNRAVAAIAPRLAAKVYGLDILAEDIEDAAHNTTRFIIMSRTAKDIEAGQGPAKTAFLFEVRNIPAALYKVMGGFATNGINMTKLESYQIGGSFTATQFYAEIEGHPDERPVQIALEELGFFSQSLKILGVFPAKPALGF